MCWITLTPSTNKKKKPPASSACSSAEIVRVHHSPKPRFSDLSVALPSSVADAPEPHHHHAHHHRHDSVHLPDFHAHAPLPHGLLQHHHRHPHLALHPLHLHPVAPLRGLGRKLSVDVSVDRPCAPAPTRACSPASQRHEHGHAPPPPPPASSVESKPCVPLYRTQIVEPAAVRASTRVALRDVRVRGRANRDVPWDWDCVSSTVGSGIARGGKKGGGKKGKKKKGGGGRLKYPPFGGMEQWL